MGKALYVLFAVAFALSSSAGIAAVKPQDVSVQVLSCPSGDLCAWPVTVGSSNRCRWDAADPDWPCSWSRSRPVRVVYNNTSRNDAGVCLCPAPYYQGDIAYFLRRGGQAQVWPGVIIGSHRWVEEANECFG